MQLFIAGPLAWIALIVLCGSAAVQANTIDLTIIDPYVDMHTGPGRGFPVHHVIERGETGTLLKQRTDWLQIRSAKGKTGWVHRSSLRLTLGPDDKLWEFYEAGINDYLARRWSGGFAAGDFGGADALTAFGAYRFTNNLSVEAKLAQAIGDFSDNLIFGMSLVHETWPEWRVSPYFAMGVAAIKTTPDVTLVQTRERTDTMMMVSLGAQSYLSRRFLLKLEYTNNIILTDRNNNEEVNEWKFGFNVFF